MVNVALVVLDTLRKDTFDEYFDWIPGTSFENAYSTANWTAPAHASLFTGKYGSEVGVHAKSRNLDCDDPVLPELLSDEGYATRGMSANQNASSKNMFDRGFDEFANPSKIRDPSSANVIDWEQFVSQSAKDGMGLYLDAIKECIFGDYDTIPSLNSGIGQKLGGYDSMNSVEDDGASTILDEVDRIDFGDSEFLFLNLMEMHTPYDPPADFNTLGKSVSINIKNTFEGVSNPEDVRQAYRDSANYLSTIYKQIFESLSDDFDYIITVSDHGEMLGEYDLWNHTYGLHEEVTHVPVVLTDTTKSAKETVESPVSLLDVHKTIVNITDIDCESRGQDLRKIPDADDRLVEYRGLIQVAKKRLNESGISEEQIQEYDAPFSALVAKEGWYAIGTDSGSVPECTGIDEVNQRIDVLHEEIDEVDTEEDELSDEVLSQLEDLGYA